MKHFTILFSVMMFCSGIIGQLNTLNNNVQTHIALPSMCKSDMKHINLMQSDPTYAAFRQSSHQELMNYINNNQNSRVLSGTVTVPVVVHVIHLGESVGVGTNISDAQIQSAIDNLNDAYANTGYNGLDTEIQFTLAKRDESCGATNGIVRVNGSVVSGYSTDGITDANELDVKALSKWDNEAYYNIWIVSEIDGNDGQSGTQGYAYFPGASPAIDGAVILYNAFGYDPTGTLGYELKSYTNYNVTTIHELGHGLDLYHTFQGDDSNGDGSPDTCPSPLEDGDFCDDTDAHRRDDSNCDAFGPVDPTCNGVANSEVHNNFMAYASDLCQDRFTADQKTRMRAALELERPGLLSSLGGTAPSGSSPVAACVVNYTTPNGFGMGVTGVEFNTINLVSTTSSVAENGYFDRSCSFQTELDAGQSYPINITGGQANNQDLEVWIDFNNDGDFDDANENVFSGINDVSFSGTVNVPSSGVTLNTPLRMRVTIDWFNNTISDGCYSPQYGEVEDYTVTVNGASCTEADVPTVTSVSSVCEGESVTLNISGNLNDAAEWTIYSGSCGGTLIGSTDLSSFVAPPIFGTTTYFVRGEGGCVTPGSCGSSSVTITPADDASFSYVESSYCVAGADPVADVTGTGGGIFSSSPVGLTLNSSTGEVDLSASTIGSYTITYTTAGSCPADASVNFAVTGLDDASFSYPSNTMCVNGSDQTPDITGVNGGVFSSSPAGLVLNSSTGVVDVSASSVGNYAVVYTTSGSCSNNTTQSISINAQDDASFSYSQNVYCNSDSDPVPVVTGLQGGTYSSSPSGLALNSTTGQIDLSSSNVGIYSVTYVTNGDCPNGSTQSIEIESCLPVTQLQTSYCGMTVTSFTEGFYADLVGASKYRFRAEDPMNPGIYFVKTTGGGFGTSLSQLGITAFNTTYNIEVAGYFDGVWADYGPICTVTTPGQLPTTTLISSFCDITASSFTQGFYAQTISGATKYQFRAEDPNVPGVYFTNVSGGYGTSLSQLGITAVSTLYNVQVRVKINGVWGPYGGVCTVTTPGQLPTTTLMSSFCDITASSFTQGLYAQTVSGATGYRFIAEDPNNPGVVYAKTVWNGFGTNLDQLGITAGNTLYNVRVRAKVNGVWGPYGAICTVTSPSSLAIAANEDAYGASKMYIDAFAGGSTDLNENLMDLIKMYPNPTNGMVNLDLPMELNADQMNVVIYNAVGAKVQDLTVYNGNNSYDLSYLESGVYLVRIVSGDMDKTIRLIKQ